MAKDIKRHVTHIKSNVENQTPAASDILLGEIAVNYHKGKEFLSIKNESGDVVTFKTKEVSVTQDLTGGTKIGSISVNGTSTDLYCSGGTSIDDTKIAFVGKKMGSGDSVTHSNEYVWADSAQNIEAANQAIIRNNIGAAAASDVTTLSGQVTTINNAYVSGTGGTSTVKNIVVASSLPSSPDSQTLYIITES